MAHHGRHLAMDNGDQTPVTFIGGNKTYLLPNLGHLYYVEVSVGTPGVSFVVALDTSGDLFWLPCDCNSCVRNFRTPSGKEIALNIYSPNASTTSAKVPCNSTLCVQKANCSSTSNACPYQVRYGDDDTSTTGILVEDVLHLTTNNNQSKVVNAPITFGCGQVETGLFLRGAAFNGVFGLGMANKSVPSILARQGLVSNSFSMCFGPDGIGRISFGDKGSLDQGETPLNIGHLFSTYNVSIDKMSVGNIVVDHSFSAVFDSGTAITHLHNPAYSLLCDAFNSQAKEKRYILQPPYEFCYEISPNQTTFELPTVNLTMNGGDQFLVNNPVIMISHEGETIYCLGIIRSEIVNIIGENFMSGYNLVFDREKTVLGWKASNCYDDTLPISPTNAPTPAMTPEATPPKGNYSPQLKAFTYTLMMVFIPFLSIV